MILILKYFNSTNFQLEFTTPNYKNDTVFLLYIKPNFCSALNYPNTKTLFKQASNVLETSLESNRLLEVNLTN